MKDLGKGKLPIRDRTVKPLPNQGICDVCLIVEKEKRKQGVIPAPDLSGLTGIQRNHDPSAKQSQGAGNCSSISCILRQKELSYHPLTGQGRRLKIAPENRRKLGRLRFGPLCSGSSPQDFE
jgi:hypothetical protein